MKFVIVGFKAVKSVCRKVRTLTSTVCTRVVFRLNGIYPNGVKAVGVPTVNVSPGGRAEIGRGFYLRTGCGDTEVGSVGTRIPAGPCGKLVIGERVGASNVTIVAQRSVEIGDDTFLGGGVQVFDTNSHFAEVSVRCSGHENKCKDVRTAPVKIDRRIFIGANALVCKGVSIGDEAVVADGWFRPVDSANPF